METKVIIESIGSVQLGVKSKEKLLRGILPEGFTETAYKNTTFWAIRVLGKHLTDNEWSLLYQKLRAEFGEHLMEVYSLESNGIDFVVYLKRTVDGVIDVRVGETLVRIDKEPDDPLCLRISAGGKDNQLYLVYRGDLKEIKLTLQKLLQAVDKIN